MFSKKKEPSLISPRYLWFYNTN